MKGKTTDIGSNKDAFNATIQHVRNKTRQTDYSTLHCMHIIQIRLLTYSLSYKLETTRILTKQPYMRSYSRMPHRESSARCDHT